MSALKQRLEQVEARTPEVPPHIYHITYTYTVGDPPEMIAALRQAEIAKLGELREPHLMVTRAFVRPRPRVEPVTSDEL
jgi:hypothetical protein